MPASWAVELGALGLLIRALAGDDVAGDARAELDGLDPARHPGASPVGWLQLAIALSEQREGRLDGARDAAARAIDAIDHGGSSDPYDLALRLAAELDVAHSTAAMRYARRQLSLRWSYRTAAHGSMQGRIGAERLRREHDVIAQQAHLDDLTALLNRRGFARYLESIARQSIGSIALLVADLDHFKGVNDQFGHQVGDMVLVAVGQVLHAHVRPADCAVRLGGDEFAIVLASASIDVGRRRADALVDAVRRHPWHELAPDLSITISVGLASGATADFAELTERADRALYAAKRQGRDRVVSDLVPESA
ncbi:MAG: GGDEF domain-containing protein [Acidimicrobiales bacterium]